LLAAFNASKKPLPCRLQNIYDDTVYAVYLCGRVINVPDEQRCTGHHQETDTASVPQ